MGIFKGFGLIDIFFLILWLRITYEAASKGLFIEILKILALFINSVFTFQFYPFIAEKLTNKVSFLGKDLTNGITAIVLFVILAIVVGLIIKIIDALFKRKEIAFAEKIAAIILGFVRVLFLTSVLVFFLHLFSAQAGFFGGYTSQLLKGIAPKTYLATAKGIGKVFPGFVANAEVEKFLAGTLEKTDSREGNKKN
ncbi:MAG: CvpA family protein [Candidatus Omnitrophica bacterium]|nr:CvpA family protein [Candidatus Omnitrophota bacterium]